MIAYFRTSVLLLLLDVLVLSVPVAVPLVALVPDAVPDAEPEIEPDALTLPPASVEVVDEGDMVAELEEVCSTACVLLLVELVAAESAAASVPEVLVFVSTEQPATLRAMAMNADDPITLSLFRFMVVSLKG